MWSQTVFLQMYLFKKIGSEYEEKKTLKGNILIY